MDMRIEKLEEKHWGQVREIFIQGIETEIATFTQEAPSYEEWRSSHISGGSLVVVDEDRVLGWVALSPTSSRCAYIGVAEVSVYVRNCCKGLGVGNLLLNSIILLSEEMGFWTLQSLIISKNTLSLALHKKCGFREIGFRERVGKMNNREWLDVTIVERRSKVVGIN